MTTTCLPLTSFEVWQAIAAAIAGKSITVDGKVITIPRRFANPQPEQRNREGAATYPSLVFRCFVPTLGDMVVNELLTKIVTLDHQAPYLDGVKAATLALAHGQTLQLRRWNDGVPVDQELVLDEDDFVDIGAATVGELLAVLNNGLTGVYVTIRPSNTIRIKHDVAASGSGLQVIGGTATALVSSFPDYRVQGRDAGDWAMEIEPPAFYDFPFHLVIKADRMDHWAMMCDLIDRMFIVKIPGALPSPNQRAIQVALYSYEVKMAAGADSPIEDEGVFVTTYPCRLVNVPIARALADALALGDNFNGGNFDGTGTNPLNAGPLDIEFVLNVEEVGLDEDL